MDSVLTMLGGHKVFGRKVRTAYDLADAIENGLPRAAAVQLASHLDLTEGSLAKILGVSARTLQRSAATPKAKLTLVQGDRLYRLARLAAFAEEVFEDTTRAHEWLREPQFGLGNRIPLDLLRTEAGAQEVEDLLGRIEHGVFS